MPVRDGGASFESRQPARVGRPWRSALATEAMDERQSDFRAPQMIGTTEPGG